MKKETKKYCILTSINKRIHYVRRYRENKYSVAVTMLTTNILKAASFNYDRAVELESKMGIGYGIHEVVNY